METRGYTDCSVCFNFTSALVYQSQISDTVVVAEMRDSVDKYLETASTSDVRSLADIIQYNKKHPDQQAGIGSNMRLLFST